MSGRQGGSSRITPPPNPYPTRLRTTSVSGGVDSNTGAGSALVQQQPISTLPPRPPIQTHAHPHPGIGFQASDTLNFTAHINNMTQATRRHLHESARIANMLNTEVALMDNFYQFDATQLEGDSPSQSLNISVQRGVDAKKELKSLRNDIRAAVDRYHGAMAKFDNFANQTSKDLELRHDEEYRDTRRNALAREQAGILRTYTF